MKAHYKDRYQDSYVYSQKYSIPWLESQGFKILSNEEKNNTTLDKKYGVDYTAISPSNEKVAIMMRNNVYCPSFKEYNFILREEDLKTNNLREYYRLSATYKDWKNSKIFKEYGIVDYIAVQTYCNITKGVKIPASYAWTSYQNIVKVIDLGYFSRYTVGHDKPARMLSIPWKQFRLNGLDINMSVFTPHRAEYTPQTGLQLL